jgi:isoleucyl-tRNA synthetase
VYLDTAKDRLYIRASDDFARRSCQTVLYHTLRCLLALVAPILPHMAEDAFQSMPESCKPQGMQSVFQAGWGDVPEQWGSVPADELVLLEAIIQASPTAPCCSPW